MRKYSDGRPGAGAGLGLCEGTEGKERRKSDYSIREVEGSKREMFMTRHNSLERSHDVSRQQMAGSGLGPLQLMYRDWEGGESPHTLSLYLTLLLSRWPDGSVRSVPRALFVSVSGPGLSHLPRDGGPEYSAAPHRITGHFRQDFFEGGREEISQEEKSRSLLHH